MKRKKYTNFLSIFICLSMILLSCHFTDDVSIQYRNYNNMLLSHNKVSAQNMQASVVSSTAIATPTVTTSATTAPAVTASAITNPTASPVVTSPAGTNAPVIVTPIIPSFTPTVPTPAPTSSEQPSPTKPFITTAPRITPTPLVTPRPIVIPTANVQYLVNVTVTYTGPAITKPTTITKDHLIVTAYYSNQKTEIVSDYTFLSSTEITSPGNYTITIFYSGLKASCYILYDDGTLPNTYTITLNSNNGTTMPAITNIAPNSTIFYPSTPVYYGYRFRGWFTSPDFTKEFSEYDKITRNMTLYAKWEKKEDPDRDIFTNYTVFNNYNITIRADLTGQSLSRYINLNTKPINNNLISDLCKNICSSSKYFGFSLDLIDYTFSDKEPPLITISIPADFDSSKIAVYYTTNNKTIAGKMHGIITPNAIDGQDSFTFYAYAPGTYILAETDTLQTPPSTAAPEPVPYITMSSIGKVKIHSQVAPNVKLHNSSKNISKIKLIWSSSNPSVASVSKNGIVSALSLGTATITVRSKDGTMSASKKITVTTKKPIKTLTLNASKKTLKKGKTFQIHATIKPIKASRKKLHYSSSKPSVAKVTKRGKIIAKKKGTCIITVKTTDGSSISKKIKVTVKK